MTALEEIRSDSTDILRVCLRLLKQMLGRIISAINSSIRTTGCFSITNMITLNESILTKISY